MAAPALQRSSVSFRRQGSSGLVWDDRLFSGELAHPTKPEVKPEIEAHDAVKLSDAVPTDVEAPGPGRAPKEERKERKKRSNYGRGTDGPKDADERGSATKRTSCGCFGILVSSHRPRKAKGMTNRR